MDVFLQPSVPLKINRTVDVRFPAGRSQFPVRRLREQQQAIDFTSILPPSSEQELVAAVESLADPNSKVIHRLFCKQEEEEDQDDDEEEFSIFEMPAEGLAESEDAVLEPCSASSPSDAAASSSSDAAPGGQQAEAAPAETPLQVLQKKLESLKSFGGGKEQTGRKIRSYRNS